MILFDLRAHDRREAFSPRILSVSKKNIDHSSFLSFFLSFSELNNVPGAQWVPQG
jgi:hypothetical protein